MVFEEELDAVVLHRCPRRDFLSWEAVIKNVWDHLREVRYLQGVQGWVAIELLEDSGKYG